MATPDSLYTIKDALRRAISTALDEIYINVTVEMPELNVEGENYSVKGTLKVIPFLSNVVKRKGKFEAKLDKNLKIISLKITEENQ